MAHRYSPRRFDAVAANPAVDLDDFNEALFATGSEAGFFDETNFGTDDAFGTTDADRVAYMARDLGVSTSRVSNAPGSPEPTLAEESGFVVIATRTVTCLDATLRVAGMFTVDSLTNVVGLQADIRINGQRVHDHTASTVQVQPLKNVSAVIEVPAGTHRVDLVAQIVGWTGSATAAVERRTLSVVVLEK